MQCIVNTDRYTPMTDQQKTASLNLRIRADLKRLAMQAASDDHRTVTSLIEKLLSEYLQENGYLPKPKTRGKAR